METKTGIYAEERSMSKLKKHILDYLPVYIMGIGGILLFVYVHVVLYA